MRGIVVLMALLLTIQSLSAIKLKDIIKYTTITSTIVAVGADMMGEYNYQKYRNSDNASDCVRYRKNTTLWGRVRNVSIGISITGIISLIVIRDD